jgi:transcriptional regulator with XRE-family HTH domain
MPPSKVPTLDQVVGHNLRRLHEAAEMTQDEVARRARGAGLPWSRSTVAALEAGTKTIDVAELVGLAIAVAPLTELLAGNGPVRLGALAIDLGTVRKVLAGKSDLLSQEDADYLMQGARRVAAAWAVHGEAEQKAARKLHMDALDLATAAQRRWGRSLTEERDARVKDSAPADLSPRSRQALRGRVTRQLLEELAPVFNRAAAKKPRRKGS